MFEYYYEFVRLMKEGRKSEAIYTNYIIYFVQG